MKKLRTGYEVLSASIAEMTTDANAGEIDIPVDETKVKRLLEKDSKPMFVTIQVAREGKSKNGKIYSAETMKEIAEQINKHQPDGYSGHMTEEERKTKNPDAETIWLGAKVTKDKDGKTCVYAKGYVMPLAKKRRSYLETAFALGKNVAVSIFGDASKAVYNAKEKAYDIFGLDVTSVDWARSRSEGIPNDGTLILTSEMFGNNNPEEDNQMTLAEALKTAKLSDIREHAPELITEMETEATKDTVAISEMVTLQEMVGAEKVEDTATKISEMTGELNTFKMNSEIDSRVEAKSARPVIKKMALAEMKATPTASVKETVEKVLQTSQAKAIISEMTAIPRVDPTNDARSQSNARTRKFTKARS